MGEVTQNEVEHILKAMGPHGVATALLKVIIDGRYGDQDLLFADLRDNGKKMGDYQVTVKKLAPKTKDGTND